MELGADLEVVGSAAAAVAEAAWEVAGAGAAADDDPGRGSARTDATLGTVTPTVLQA